MTYDVGHRQSSKSSEVASLTCESSGNAKIAGMQDGLHLSSGQYSISLIVFFISYVIFEVPSMLKKSIPCWSDGEAENWVA